MNVVQCRNLRRYEVSYVTNSFTFVTSKRLFQRIRPYIDKPEQRPLEQYSPGCSNPQKNIVEKIEYRLSIWKH